MTSAPIFTHQEFIKAIIHTRLPCSQNEYKFPKITITFSVIQQKVPCLYNVHVNFFLYLGF